jgi:hypothetical protein
MKNNIYIFIILIIIILVFSFYNTYTAEKQENFTPYLRQLYRPHIRNARIKLEEQFETNKTKLQNMLRKVGIM